MMSSPLQVVPIKPFFTDHFWSVATGQEQTSLETPTNKDYDLALFESKYLQKVHKKEVCPPVSIKAIPTATTGEDGENSSHLHFCMYVWRCLE